MRKLLVILGTPIDNVTMAEALQRIGRFVSIGRQSGKWHQIATVNADFIVKALGDPALQRILQKVDMATADGMPLVWGARRLGVPVQGRVTGVDLVPAIAKMAAEKGLSIYLLGAAPGVAQRTSDILVEQYPNLKIAGVAAPSRSAVDNQDPSIIDACKAANPDILLVAFGNPRQEKWIDMNGDALGIPVMIGVGGTFDFITGVTTRAPQWMQSCGLEWLHRLCHEPRRLWKRYAADLVGFGYFFLLQWWAMRKGRNSIANSEISEVILTGEPTVLSVQGRLDISNQHSFMATAHKTLGTEPFLIVDLADVEFLDSAAIGSLVALTKQARDAGGNVWLTNVPSPIERILSLLRLEQFFEICEDLESALANRRAATEGLSI
ncbi:MAG: WecB/TagA/CpsF family glycosyltransferase [Chloroflexota bacterium]